jgi:hypothetical protein
MEATNSEGISPLPDDKGFEQQVEEALSELTEQLDVILDAWLKRSDLGAAVLDVALERLADDPTFPARLRARARQRGIPRPRLD